MEILFENDGEIAPGEVQHLSVKIKNVFRGEGAERVDGVDYSAFEVCSVFINAMSAWKWVSPIGRFPIADLFGKWDMPMRVAESGDVISLTVCNTTEQPRKFAIKIVGSSLEIRKIEGDPAVRHDRVKRYMEMRMEEHILQFFEYEHLPERLQRVSKPFYDLARAIVADDGNALALPRNPERTVALRKILEAKDAAVRAAVAK